MAGGEAGALARVAPIFAAVAANMRRSLLHDAAAPGAPVTS